MGVYFIRSERTKGNPSRTSGRMPRCILTPHTYTFIVGKKNQWKQSREKETTSSLLQTAPTSLADNCGHKRTLHNVVLIC
jgi:hypothetical protein